METIVNRCENCAEMEERAAELHRKLAHIRAILAGNGDGRGRREQIFATEHGRLIAAAASAKGITLRLVSRGIGRADDYVARICRGDLALGRPAAIVIGHHLGIDLVPFVGGSRAPAVQPSLTGVNV